MISIILLAVTALFLISIIIILPLHKINNIKTPIIAVLPVKNCEDSIEGTLRHLLNQNSALPSHKNPAFEYLVVLDIDSVDQTFEIAEKIATKHPFIYPLRKSDCLELLDKM